MSLVFPDFAVKQAFCEVELDRADDVIIASIQSDLVIRCLTPVLKGALISCIVQHRKYINASDVAYALRCCSLPRSSRESKRLGYLLHTRHFGNTCATQIEALLAQMVKYGTLSEPHTVKFSSETLTVLQDAVESLIRGSLEHLVAYAKGRPIGYRLFDECLSKLLGEPLVETNYVPVDATTRAG